MHRRKIDYDRSDLLLGHVTLTEKQKKYLEIITSPSSKIILLSGAAGSSKTFLALYAAFVLYNKNNQLKIRYVRSVVESANKSLGYLKGSLDNKIDPYLTPLKEKIQELLTEQEAYVLEKRKVIEGVPVNFLRGSDWKNMVAIIDEAQNLSFKEIITVVTRINKDTKIILCGDFMQSDIRDSGFETFCELFNDEDSKAIGIHHLPFDLKDIKRDPVVNFILKRIEKNKL